NVRLGKHLKSWELIRLESPGAIRWIIWWAMGALFIRLSAGFQSLSLLIPTLLRSKLCSQSLWPFFNRRGQTYTRWLCSLCQKMIFLLNRFKAEKIITGGRILLRSCFFNTMIMSFGG